MKIRICIIGCGNISNTRHIPAILKNPNMEIIGAISDNRNNIENTVKVHSVKRFMILDKSSVISEQLTECGWFIDEVDAVVIGTPPMEHFTLAYACLSLGKHVLVEKPMMMDEKECITVMKLASEKQLILNVMHSFQFASGIMKMERCFLSGEFGNIESIVEIQFTNRNRRLPSWYNELPLGLYYDEAAHFFYTARRFGGELKVLNAAAQFNEEEATPKFLQAQLMAGEIPVQMIMNFNSPICEWYILLLCEKKVALYDFFKDILIVMDNDNQHLSKDVLRTSRQFFSRYWKGFICNGVKMILNKLLYGHDIAIDAFGKAIATGYSCSELSAELGLEVVSAMNDVVEKVKGVL